MTSPFRKNLNTLIDSADASCNHFRKGVNKSSFGDIILFEMGKFTLMLQSKGIYRSGSGRKFGNFLRCRGVILPWIDYFYKT